MQIFTNEVFELLPGLNIADRVSTGLDYLILHGDRVISCISSVILFFVGNLNRFLSWLPWWGWLLAIFLLSCRVLTWKKGIVISAMKQSRKAWLPQVLPLEPFKSFVDNSRHGLRCIAHCYDEVPRHDLYSLLQEYAQSAQASRNSTDASPASVTILVGPEGDFSIDEVRYALDHGFQSVSLGQARLRTETAGLVSVMTAQMVQQHPLSVTQPCPAAQ